MGAEYISAHALVLYGDTEMTVEEFKDKRRKLKAELKCGKITESEFAHAIQKMKYEYVAERK